MSTFLAKTNDDDDDDDEEANLEKLFCGDAMIERRRIITN